MPSVSFGSSLSQRVYAWTAWKTEYLARTNTNPQYADDGSKYDIYFYDGPEVHTCQIWKVAVPYSFAYNQAQNDIDRADFETNYQVLCNKPIVQRMEITSVSSVTALPSVDQVQPTFFVVFDRVVPAALKYVATLWNGSATHKLVLQRIRVYNWQLAAVTGVLLEQQLERITARTAGVAVAVRACDTADVLPTGVAADSGSTGVTVLHLVERIFTTNDEMALTANNISTWRVELAGAVTYDRKPGTTGHTLRPGQGFAVKNITAAAVGSVSYIFEFTAEAL